MLSNLPPNLTKMIVILLDKSDMCALARTSKHLYNATVPHLYKHLKIRMPCKNILSGIRDFF
ncbi:hypothetical protein BDV41DRAFT_543266, partial [Aspergillus transmontanensis]